MKKNQVKPKDAIALRRRAEARLSKRQWYQRSKGETPKSDADTQRLLHELQVHQIELEMQNEELSLANARAEALAEKYADLYDFAPIGYVTVDDCGSIQELNLAAARLLGPPRAALIGTPFFRHMTGRERDTFLPQLEACSETDKQMTWEVGLGCSGKDRLRPVQLCAVLHRSAPGQPPQYRLAISDISERKRSEEAICQLNAELEERVRQRTATIRTLAAELTLAEQREKARLAQVLHDHLQQLLVGARFLLESVRQDSTERDRETLLAVDQLLAQSVEAARTLTVELSPPVLQKEGLVAALQWLGDWMREKHGLAVEVKSEPSPGPLSEELSILLYHALRELLFNVVKHAEVKSARVALDWPQTEARIVVNDRGKGFDPTRLGTAPPSTGKFGLFAIRERLELLDGQLEVESAPGRGSRFTLRVPRHKPDAPRAKGKANGVS